jgi:hypothetical protein
MSVVSKDVPGNFLVVDRVEQSRLSGLLVAVIPSQPLDVLLWLYRYH